METILDIAKILALVSVAALCAFLIVLLLRVKDTVSNLKTVMNDVAEHAIPVIDNLEAITTKVNAVTQTVEQQIDLIKDSVGAVRQMTDSIVSFERHVQDRIEGPVLEAVSTVRALSKGVQAAASRLRR